MARVVLEGYIGRYPLGGMASWVLQYLLGFKSLGHEIYFVERCTMEQECYDPRLRIMTDDCSSGVEFLEELLRRFEVDGWCFVDYEGKTYGLTREEIRDVMRTTDLFLDVSTQGAWIDYADRAGARVLIDGEPGFFQMKMVQKQQAGEPLVEYDFYYTNGHNIGRPTCLAPSAGKEWRGIFNPVQCDLFDPSTPRRDVFTTVMNWQSHPPFTFDGQTYGQKDVAFERFMSLPQLSRVPLEVAVTGPATPTSRLKAAGWNVADAQMVTASFDSFTDYIADSAGEFSVCKEGYVSTRTGWFGDRSAAYLAAGRPVVCQDTGFSEHLPCGDGLFAVATAEDAAEALREVSANYEHHSRAARSIAREFLDAPRVLGRLLDEIGM